jgi:hypothetical protein
MREHRAAVHSDRRVLLVCKNYAGKFCWKHCQKMVRAVLVAAPPRVAKELFPSLESPASEEVRAACLDVALGAVPCPRNRFVMGLDAPLYYSLHSAVARLAPEGGGVDVD